VIPLKDNVPTRSFPIVTIGLIAANVAVWYWEWKTGVNKEVLHYGYYPCTLAGPCDPRFVPPNHLSWYDGVFTSMFMHASWFHIGGNMLFLWIFGNNIEDSLGRVRFFFWYLGAGLAAAFAQTFVTLQFSDPAGSSIPNIGASGAIAGVLGAYLVLLPNASVTSSTTQRNLFVRSPHRSVVTQIDTRISAPPMVGVPALVRCERGPSSRTAWPVL